jgi:hypothetical protein
MKFLTVSVICFVFFIGARAFPTIVDEFVSEDEIANNAIADQFKDIRKLSQNNKFVDILLRSIDQKCMVEKYKENKLVNMLTDEKIDMTHVTLETPIDPLLVFTNIGVLCSNKLNAILEFLFDNIFSFSGLIDAFKNEHFIEELLFDNLTCYNNYAVKMNILSHEKYPKLSITLVNQNQNECNETIDGRNALEEALLEMALAFVATDHASCLGKEIKTLDDKTSLKYGLLLPIGLSDAEKREEKPKFVHDIREGLERILACVTQEKEVRKSLEQTQAKFLAILENTKYFHGKEAFESLKTLLEKKSTKPSFDGSFNSL